MLRRAGPVSLPCRQDLLHGILRNSWCRPFVHARPARWYTHRPIHSFSRSSPGLQEPSKHRREIRSLCCTYGCQDINFLCRVLLCLCALVSLWFMPTVGYLLKRLVLEKRIPKRNV